MESSTAAHRVGHAGELKQERARRTRAHLLACAAELFAEHGYAGVTIQDVAHRGGLTKGAVYFHFKNKEELAVAVVEAHYAQWPTLIEQVNSRALSPFDTLVAVLETVAKAFQEDSVIQAGVRLQNERVLIATDLPKPFIDWEEAMTELVERAYEAGELVPSAAPAPTARLIVAAFFGLQHISDVLTHRVDLADRFADLRVILLANLRASPNS